MEKRIDCKDVIKELSSLVLASFFLGQIIHALWTKQVTHIRNKFYLRKWNNFALLVVIWSVFCTVFANGIFEKIEKKDLFIFISD